MRTSPKAHEDSWDELYEDLSGIYEPGMACVYFSCVDPELNEEAECEFCPAKKLIENDPAYAYMTCREAMAQHIVERAQALVGSGD